MQGAGTWTQEATTKHPLLATLAATFGFSDATDLPLLAVAAFAGGMVRGFTGFGFSMVFVPIATIAVGPAGAAALLWVIDIPFAYMLAASSWRRVDWKEIAPLLAGAVVFLPLGVWMLTHSDPLTTRWTVVSCILVGVACLATGWRYHGPPGLMLSLGVGALAGTVSGLAQIGGLPIAIFWLAAQAKAARQTRDNLNGFFCLLPTVAGVAYVYSGVITAATIWQAIPLFVPYGVGLLIGTKLFPLASEVTFRRIAYGVIVVAAALAMPALDSILRR